MGELVAPASLTFLLAGILAGCSDAEPEPTPQVSRGCSKNAECGKGLVCARGGDFAGMCTANCTSTTECETRFGDGVSCVGDYCTLACDHSDQCGTNGYCRTDLCFSGKAGMSDTCSNDRQCEPGLTCSPALYSAGTCVAPCTVNADCDPYGVSTDCVVAKGLCAERCSDELNCSGNSWCHDYVTDDGFSSGYCGLP